MDEIKNVKDLGSAEPRAIADNIIRILDDKKAGGLKLLHVEEHSSITDYIVVCTGSSNTQIKSLSAEVEYVMGLCGQTPLNIEGYNEGIWVVVDFGSVMVHIFSRDSRDFYKLEKLYEQSSEVDISDLISD